MNPHIELFLSRLTIALHSNSEEQVTELVSRSCATFREDGQVAHSKPGQAYEAIKRTIGISVDEVLESLDFIVLRDAPMNGKLNTVNVEWLVHPRDRMPHSIAACYLLISDDNGMKITSILEDVKSASSAA